MKISVLVNDLSFHGLVRTCPIAKVLERKHEVELVGPVFGDGIFEPYRDAFTFKSVSPKSLWWHDARKVPAQLAELADGDVLYAFKPMWTSFGVALKAKKARGCPVVLDLEDLDHLYAGGSVLEKSAYTLGSLLTMKSKGMTRYLQTRADEADAITVVSKYLQERYGGTKLPHGADTTIFDPALHDRAAIREHYGFGEQFIILFNGTINPHKGVDEIIAAIEHLADPRIQLVLAGKESNHLRRLRANKSAWFRHLGSLPHAEMPALLGAVDSMVLPQRDEVYARAQVPGKVFEAMAMGLPIVATALSDLPEILEGCGRVVQPGDVPALADAIRSLVDDADEAARLGAAARQRAITHYSWDAMAGILDDVFGKWA